MLVDPKTLKIKAIIDWEFGGFWPEWFERPFWKRSGASYALEGEDDDTERCREWLAANCEEIEQPHLPTLKDKLGSMPWTPESWSQSRSEPTSQKVEPAAWEEVGSASQRKGEPELQVQSATVGEIAMASKNKASSEIQKDFEPANPNSVGSAGKQVN